VAMKMGKGFDVPGLVNHDVVELLNEAFVRKVNQQIIILLIPLFLKKKISIFSYCL
jgi:hypothetical protein